MVTGDGSGDNGGISLGACCASCLVTGHGRPVILRPGQATSHKNHWNTRGPFLAYSGPQLREDPDSVLARGLSTPLALTLIRDTYRPRDDVSNLLDAIR